MVFLYERLLKKYISLHSLCVVSSLFSYHEYHQNICDSSKMKIIIHNMHKNSSFKKSFRCFSIDFNIKNAIIDVLYNTVQGNKRNKRQMIKILECFDCI